MSQTITKTPQARPSDDLVFFPHVPTRLNVEPDPSLRSEVEQFLKWGYLVKPDVLDAAALDALRSAMDEMAERYAFENKEGAPFNDLFHKLFDEDKRFHSLMMQRTMFPLIQQVLGTCVSLHSTTGRIVMPGTKDQVWHRDTCWPVDPDGTPIGAIPSQINTIYYLDDVDPETGPTVVLPGSHKSMHRGPDGFVRFPDEVRITCKAGTCALVNNYLLHRGSANTSQRRRRTILICFQNSWIKSRDRFEGSLTAELKKNGTPQERMLLNVVERW